MLIRVQTGMRLTMMMERPVVFPDLDPGRVLSCRKTSGLSDALQAYGEALLECNVPCMEASESALEVVRALKRHHAGIGIRELGGDRFSLSCGPVRLVLEGSGEGSVHLVFTPGNAGIDVSDFGPADVARFIRAVFASRDRIEGLGFTN